MSLSLQIRRVMLFARNMDSMTHFYHKVLGLPIISQSDGFVDLDAGNCHIALHRSNRPNPGATKICFYAPEVDAARADLETRGVKIGPAPQGGNGLQLCDFEDPEGNRLQLSNRA